MSAPFDASLIDNDPIADDVRAKQRAEVEGCMTMQGALANAKLHAENELQRLVALCNRLAWGTGAPYGAEAPDAGSTAALLEQMKSEDRERLLKEAKAAKEQRALVRDMVQAEALLHLRMQTEQVERARMEAERRDWAEFETIDQAQKQARFEAWRASRQRS